MTDEIVVKKGRPADPSSYYSLLKNYNKNTTKAERMECECGKVLFKSQYENHLTTKIHEQLLKYKKLAEQDENLINKLKANKKEDKDNDELMLKLRTNIDYRKSIKSYIDMLDNIEEIH